MKHRPRYKSAIAAYDWFPADPSIQATLEEIVSNGRAVGVIVGLLESDGSRRMIAYGSAGPNALPIDGDELCDEAALAVSLDECVQRAVDPPHAFDAVLPSEDAHVRDDHFIHGRHVLSPFRS